LGKHASLGVEAERPNFINDAHGKTRRKRPAMLVRVLRPSAPDSQLHIEQRWNDSDFIVYAEFIQDFADAQTQD